jgi:alkylhydroperoxidase family enzyme
MNMRLRILDSGHGFGTKVLFALIRTASRQPVLDVIKLVKYRADFYGRPLSALAHEAMRGPSTWSVGDRELMAAFVAKTNRCEFCTEAHAAVAQRAYGEGKMVSAFLSDPDTATIEGHCG